MKAIAVWVSLILSYAGAVAGSHYIGHVAEEGWTTTITVYNNTSGPLDFDLRRWDESATETVTAGIAVPANGFTTLTNTDFGYEGTAMVYTPTDSPLRIKLAYRYGDSQSLCEFFIPGTDPGTKYMLSNPYQSHFDWFGMAVSNFNATAANVTLTAWKNGTVVDTTSESVPPKGKVVDVSSGFWSGIHYPDVDLVTIESDLPIPPPLSITGNNQQDRHVFFLADPIARFTGPTLQTYVIPHVAEESWKTVLTVYNNASGAVDFQLNSWDQSGTPDVEGLWFNIPANSTMTFEAGTDFAYRGIVVVYTEAELNFKLAYQYGISQSICEFFLKPMEFYESTKWFLPNSIRSWFDWFGVAVCNPTHEEITIGMDAYKNGVLIDTATRVLPPHTKTVGLAADYWQASSAKSKAGAAYNDVDMVVIRSSAPISAPISITGNNEQDRHVFFQADDLPVDPQFPDEAFRQYVMDNFDTDHNGILSQAEADAVFYIDTPGDYLSQGNIKDITGVTCFRNLQTLYCSYENISWLPDLTPLTALSSFDASYNKIADVSVLGEMPSLTSIYVHNNQITELPELDQLVNLDYLMVSENQLTELPPVNTLTNLTGLQFSRNQISSFPNVSALNLQILTCEFNNLSLIPSLAHMTNLNTFYCQGNQLAALPDISGCTELWILLCDHNEITALPDLSHCTKLFNLSCSGNNLTALPDLSGLTALKYLSANQNDITTLPGIGNLTELLYLSISETLITDLSGLSTVTKLVGLNCAYAPVSVWPDFNLLDDLTTLNCTSCGLTDLPDVTGCASLDSLICSGNNFGADDCPMIQAIETMGLTTFVYNPLQDDGTLTCP